MAFTCQSVILLLWFLPGDVLVGQSEAWKGLQKLRLVLDLPIRISNIDWKSPFCQCCLGEFIFVYSLPTYQVCGCLFFFFFNVKCDVLFWGRAAVGEVYPNSLSLTWAQEWPSQHIVFVDCPPGLKLTLRLHLPGHISLCSWGRTSMLPWRRRLFIFLF